MSDNTDKPLALVETSKPLTILDAVAALPQVKEFFRQFATILLEVRDAVNAYRPKILEFLETIRAIPDAVKECTLELAKLGWFYDIQFLSEEFVSTLKLVRGKKVEELDSFFINHYEQQARSLQRRLTLSHPERAKPLRQAFAAASKGNYFVAIPALLAQIDGLAIKVGGGKLFTNENKRPQVASKLEEKELDGFTLAFLSALLQHTGFNASEKYEDEFPHAPNRHKIMHGIDLGYGTKANYLKTFSLLAFIGVYVPEILRNKSKVRNASKPTAVDAKV